jgi:rfaE bifunctional protein nucleotidyltransferase chain/domain
MIVPKIWGFEESSEFVSDLSAAKRILVKEQFRSETHRHKKKSENLIVSTEGLVWFESGMLKEVMTGIWLEANSSIQIPAGMWHRFTALRDTILYESSSVHVPVAQEDGRAPAHRSLEGYKEIPPCGWLYEEEVADEGTRLSPEDFRGLLSAYVKDSPKRLLEVEEAASVALAIRATKRKIGFCNGCFDLLHLGHLEMLLQAKLRCDVLFVAVNSDSSIKQIKGSLRPFVDEMARMHTVASVRYVDYVIRNPEVTCVASAKAVSPDVYIKTTENGDSGPEAQAVKAMGGVIEVVDMLPGYSTSILANGIAKSLVTPKG